MNSDNTPSTPQIILNQINTMDKRAFWAWGSKKFVGSANDSKSLGWLEFTATNCPNTKSARVRITLEYNDTYTVKVYNIRKIRGKADYKESVLCEASDVYFDTLIDTIDDIVG
jgi:hypothetical protein